MSQIQTHEAIQKILVVDLEGVPRIPMKPPLRDKLVPIEVYFIWRSLTLNAKAEKSACL